MTQPPPPDPVRAYAPPRRSNRLPWLLGGGAVLAALLCLGGAGAVTAWLLRSGDPGAAPIATAQQATAAPAPVGSDAATWPELAALSVDTEATLRAAGNGGATQVAFVNETGDVVTVSWLDPDGNRVTYKTLRPGESYTQQTYVGHPWVAAAADGRALAVFQPAAAPGRAVIR